jgi:hypothetical protein
LREPLPRKADGAGHHKRCKQRFAITQEMLPHRNFSSFKPICELIVTRARNECSFDCRAPINPNGAAQDING